MDYGSIIINLENGSFLDLLGDREQESFREWLDSHQNVKVVSRDRSTEYSAAISLTGREIIEVADRFHLIKNISDCMAKVISEKYMDYRKAVRPQESVQEEDKSALQRPEIKYDKDINTPLDSRAIKFNEVKELQKKGLK